jgi:lysophospholipase L1-like esterase
VESARSRVRESFTRIIQLARTHGIEPIVATEVTVRQPASLVEDAKTLAGWVLGRQSYRDYINREVVEQNRWLREYAACEGIFLLDFQSVLAEGSGKRRKAYAAPDGSHISPAGYDALTAYAARVFAGRPLPR